MVNLTRLKCENNRAQRIVLVVTVTLITVIQNESETSVSEDQKALNERLITQCRQHVIYKQTCACYIFPGMAIVHTVQYYIP